MKTINVEYAIASLRYKPINSLWSDEDDNDAEDFEEEWLPQDAW